MPFLINGIEVDIATAPPRDYRGAWMLDGEVVKIDPAKAAMIAIERIRYEAAEKRKEIDRGKSEANELKGALALNARDDTRPAERDKARTMLEAYAKARGESGWAAAADAIITARNKWASRVMEVEMYEELAWSQLQAATTAGQVADIEKQITEAIKGV